MELGSNRLDRSGPGRCHPYRRGVDLAISSRSSLPQTTVATHSATSTQDSSPAAKKSDLLAASSVEIEAGRWVVIRVEDPVVKVVDLTPDGISYSVDDWLLAFNAAEAIANPVVAMKE